METAAIARAIRDASTTGMTGMTAKLTKRNRMLRRRLRQLEREVRRLEEFRTFFSPGVAALIGAGAGDGVPCLARREVTVVFLDLRGFTTFTQTSDPEEVMRVLGELHETAGRLAHGHQGTIERFTGDGMMVFFNAPVEMPRPTEAAVRMALALRDEFACLAERWRARGHDLGLGIGIAHGFATVGVIGFEGRRDYGVIGTVTNLAARLCGLARGGAILASRSVIGLLHPHVDADLIGDVAIKGFVRPVTVFSVRGLREDAASPRREQVSESSESSLDQVRSLSTVRSIQRPEQPFDVKPIRREAFGDHRVHGVRRRLRLSELRHDRLHLPGIEHGNRCAAVGAHRAVFEIDRRPAAPALDGLDAGAELRQLSRTQ